MVSIVVLATLSLILQVATLTIVTSGYLLKRKGHFLIHATLMLVAVAIHVSSFVFLMGPALLSLYQNGFILKLTQLSVITILHASLGSVTLLLGVWLVAMWHLQKSTEKCVPRRLVMRYVFVLWFISLIFGITVYLILYFHL
jgi:uncharacterized membrane protein YozB (DUF420 family)